jgi:hypothetical protein
MIEGNVTKSPVSYRQKEGLNFTSIKTFEDSGPAIFYREYVLGDRKEKMSPAIAIGSLVDDIVLTYNGDVTLFQQHFDERYCKFEGVKSSAQAFVLADVLFDILIETSVDGKITGDFKTCFIEAFNKVQADGKYKGKTWEKGLEDFEANAKTYFDSRIKNIGKIVVDLNMISVAENVSTQLLQDEFTSDLLRQVNNPLITKVELEFKMLNGSVKCKSEVDAVEVDRETKTLFPYDLKCTFDNEEFDYMYVKNRYYLQQAFYSIGLQQWKVENGFADYIVAPFSFIVGDTSANKRRPLIYRLSEEDTQKGIEGFSLRGNKYRGVKQLVEEIKWHMDMDIWNCSKQSFDNNGKLILHVDYDK